MRSADNYYGGSLKPAFALSLSKDFGVASPTTCSLALRANAFGIEQVVGKEVKMRSGGELKCPAGRVLIPDSRFMMGSDGVLPSDEKPRHEVRVNAFCIDNHEVTNADYDRFVGNARGIQPQFELIAKSCGTGAISVVARSSNKQTLALAKRNLLDGQNVCGLEVRDVTPAGVERKSPEGFDGPNQPVVNVNWHEANAYCEAQGGRLPTEAEWERAAIGPSKGYNRNIQYGTRSGQLSREEAVYDTNRTTDVCSKPTNGYGLCDMTGNVWEWVADWYNSDYYESSPSENPTGPSSGDYRVVRGGSWGINVAGGLRAANRGDGHPGDRGFNFGFRCVSAPEDSRKVK